MSSVATRIARRFRFSPASGRLARRASLGLGFPIMLLVVWEILANAQIINPVLIPPPSAILSTLGARIESGALVSDITTTLGEFFVGYALAALIGLPIGLAMGLWRRVDYLVEPLMIGLYSAPVIALYPLLIIVFGIGFTSIITLIVLFTIFPITVNTALGVKLIEPALVRAAVSFSANRPEVLLKIILPASLPGIASGLQLAVGRAMTGAVVAELFIGKAGLGYSIGYHASYLQLAEVFLNIFILGIMGTSLRSVMTAFERRVRYEGV